MLRTRLRRHAEGVGRLHTEGDGRQDWLRTGTSVGAVERERRRPGCNMQNLLKIAGNAPIIPGNVQRDQGGRRDGGRHRHGHRRHPHDGHVLHLLPHVLHSVIAMTTFHFLTKFCLRDSE